MTSEKQSCLILVSGYGPGLNRFLRWSDDFLARYAVNHKADVRPDALLERMTAFEQEIRASDVFIHHAADALPELGDARPAYDAILARIAQHTRTISIPRPRMPALWPFHRRVSDDAAGQPLASGFDRQPCIRFGDSYVERHADVKRPFQGRFNGSPSPAYEDRYVADRLSEGLAPAAIAESYVALDVSTTVDLGRALDDSLAAMRSEERAADVKVADFVADAMPRASLFRLVDQPANRLSLHVANQVLARLGLAPVGEAALDRTQELHGWSHPVHPGIGRFFALPYAGEDTRYQIDRVRMLTFAEYIGDYAYSLADAQAWPTRAGAA